MRKPKDKVMATEIDSRVERDFKKEGEGECYKETEEKARWKVTQKV